MSSLGPRANTRDSLGLNLWGNLDLLNFSRFQDTSTIKEWLLLHRMDPSLAEDLPEIGFVAFEGQTPVAAGFLRKMEGASAQIDSVITYPFAEAKLRHTAINMIVTALIAYAKENGIESLIAFSTDAHTLERAKRFGFRHLPHTVMSLKLKTGE